MLLPICSDCLLTVPHGTTGGSKEASGGSLNDLDLFWPSITCLGMESGQGPVGDVRLEPDDEKLDGVPTGLIVRDLLAIGRG